MRKESKYIKLTNYSLKVQFTFKITNKQQQKNTPYHNPKGKKYGDKCDDGMTYVFVLRFAKADLVL